MAWLRQWASVRPEVVLRQALEFGVLAVVEVKDKHLRRAGLGLEGPLVGRGGRVEIVWAFDEILLLFLVILADEQASPDRRSTLPGYVAPINFLGTPVVFCPPFPIS
jgi:hypothetical protein